MSAHLENNMYAAVIKFKGKTLIQTNAMHELLVTNFIMILEKTIMFK